MCNGSRGNNTSGQVSQSYADLLGPAAPRIPAGYAALPLPLVVEAVLAELTATGASFTAYDVTMVLRALFPGQRPLPHYGRGAATGVQTETHRRMADYLSAGDYTVRTIYPNGADPARLYTPVKRQRTARGWAKLALTISAGFGAAPLPKGAWVVRSGSS